MIFTVPFCITLTLLLTEPAAKMSSSKDLRFDEEDVSKFICDPDEEKDGYEIPSIRDTLAVKDLTSVPQPSMDPLEDIAPKVLTLQEARSGAEAILAYLKYQPQCPDVAKSVNDVISYLDLQRIDNLKQKKTSITPQNIDAG